jgi:S1-C subfamily serine protease
MTTQVPCPCCRHPLVVRDAYLGGIVRCPDCRHEFMPLPPRAPHPPRPAHVTRKSPRKYPHSSAAVSTTPTIQMSSPAPKARRSSRTHPPSIHRPSSMPVFLILGGFSMLAMVLIAVLGLVAWRGNRAEIAPDVIQAVEIKADDEAREPGEWGREDWIKKQIEEIKVPPAEIRLTPDEIYKAALKSTVYVVAKSVAPAGSPPPPEPKPPVNPPKMPVAKTPTKKGPDLSAELAKSVWMGTEDLTGFGRLRFDFCTPTDVVVRDAKDGSLGKWKVMDAKTVRIELASVEYLGHVSNDTIIGTAKSKHGGVSWKFAVNRKFGQVPTPLPRFVTRTGTGVLVDANRRLVATSLHIVGEAEFVDLAFPKFDEDKEPIVDPARYQSGRFRGRVVHKEPNIDLALVELEQVPAGAAEMPLAMSRVKADEVVHLVGNSGERKTLWNYRPSKVRNVALDKWSIPDAATKKEVQYDGWRIEIESAISPGDSGGPLLNDNGQLAGIAHAADVSGNRVSFYIDASEVRAAIERYRERIGDPVPKGE